jgi:hypothetical protein
MRCVPERAWPLRSTTWTGTQIKGQRFFSPMAVTFRQGLRAAAFSGVYR